MSLGISPGRYGFLIAKALQSSMWDWYVSILSPIGGIVRIIGNVVEQPTHALDKRSSIVRNRAFELCAQST
jgi:hypothetical protein